MSDASIRTSAVGGDSESLQPVVDGRGWGRVALAVLALLAAAAPFVLRLVRNAPGGGFVPAVASYETAVLAATLGPALAAVGLAASTSDRPERVALLGLAVFAPLAFVADAAYLPAGVAVTLGGSVVAWRRLERSHVERPLPSAGRHLLASVAIAGVGCSLAATMGIAPFDVRHAGTVLALGAAVSAGVATDARSVDWAAGAVAASLVYAAGTAAPYVTGAVALVAGGVVGASLPLLAAGVGGIVAATTASLRRGAFLPACGALLLLVAGVPVTVPRALAVALGVALLLEAGGERA